MAILDLIPHVFPTGSVASTLDVTARRSHDRGGLPSRYLWAYIAGLGLLSFLVAALGPAREYQSRRAHRITFSVIGVAMLIAALLVATGAI